MGSSSGRAQKAKVDVNYMIAAEEAVNHHRASKQIDVLRHRKMIRNNTLAFTGDPRGYIAGQVENAQDALAAEKLNTSAKQLAGQIGTQQSVNDAAYANKLKIDRYNRQTNTFNFLGGGLNNLLGDVSERQNKIQDEDENLFLEPGFLRKGL